MKKNYIKNQSFKAILTTLLGVLLTSSLFSQVVLRDTALTWQHHSFELNDDYSMKAYTSDDTDITQESYSSAKVIENNLIRLVVVPEYGARVISFVYKPTGHEYLYQSECGSPYGMGDGNFYYDWLMVWGGIFPTFPEPEHGKTWLMAWDYTVVEETDDVVTVRMEYTDNTSCSSAPGKFSKGITGITCRVEISVYKGSSVWDFDVSLLNNKNEKVNYEYWTCTTLTPGCEIGKTASPLNSELVVPFEQYEADWSPNNWIGRSGNLYDISDIDYLSEWDDMGIAYANNLNDNYWGVINHDNDEGIMRISENVETPGMKFWTWGKDNVDNDMFDFSNGGNDNYIELWAGASNKFFSSTSLSANETKSWKESYAATYHMKTIVAINKYAAVDLEYNDDIRTIAYSLNTFNPAEDYKVELYFVGTANNYTITSETVQGNELGIIDYFYIDDFSVADGEYTVTMDVKDSNGTLLLKGEKSVTIGNTVLNGIDNGNIAENKMLVKRLTNNTFGIELNEFDNYKVSVIGLNGQTISRHGFTGNSNEIKIQNSGLYIMQVTGSTSSFSKKLIVR